LVTLNISIDKKKIGASPIALNHPSTSLGGGFGLNFVKSIFRLLNGSSSLILIFFAFFSMVSSSSIRPEAVRVASDRI
jgi:hypothetical protein